MKEAQDQLEVELAALRPHDASTELRHRIDDHRAHSTLPKIAMAVGPRPRRRIGRCLPGGGLSPMGRQPARINGARPSFRIRPAPPVEVEDSRLTRLAYWRALARSPEELDALLDKDAIAAQRPNPQLVRICAFPRSYAALHALLGEN